MERGKWRLIHEGFIVVLFAIHFGFGAPSQAADIGDFISDLPWSESYATTPEKRDKPDFTVVVEYKKEGVFNDKWVFPLKLYPHGEGVITVKPPNTLTACADGAVNWRNTSIGLGIPSREGFTLRMSLSWGQRKKNSYGFREEFPCVWKEKQEFQKDGFTIVVRIVKETDAIKRDEPLRKGSSK